MDSDSTVLVFEFFSGGGCPAGELPDGLAAEALGMLWAVLEDFRRWGAVQTITALDPRFERIVPGLNCKTLPADCVIASMPDEHEAIYLTLLERCDAVLLIAPETDNTLSKLVELAETRGIPILGSSAAAVNAAGNKSTCVRLLDFAKLPTPIARTTDFDAAPLVAAQMGCPLVLKPLDGVSSEAVVLLERLSDLPSALKLMRRTTAGEQILVQAFAHGIPVSASLLATDKGCLPLSLNLQLIEVGAPFKYLGSQVPYEHPAIKDALALARSAVGLIPGLKGYVGVDMIMSDGLVQVIEINPRLTTSYIGLRQVAQMNLAQVIWDASRYNRLPDQFPLNGQVTIKKDDPQTWGLKPLNKEP